MKGKLILIFLLVIGLLVPAQAVGNSQTRNMTELYEAEELPEGANFNISHGNAANIVGGTALPPAYYRSSDNAISNLSQAKGLYPTLKGSTEEKNETPSPLTPGYTQSDAASDAVATGGEKLMIRMADGIYNSFGFMEGSIFQMVTFNIDPRKLPVIEKFAQDSKYLAVPLVILLLICECIAGSAATVSPATYANVFGKKDFSNESFVGGGILMVAGIGGSALYWGIMALSELVSAFFMLEFLESIKPSADNAVMYFCLAIIELILSLFFFYRQILVLAGYPLSPIYCVLYASGYAREFIDDIGDRFVRAVMMQPLCILVIGLGITVMKAFEWTVAGVVVWDADDEMLFYVIIGYLAYRTCKWCIKGDWSIVRRTVGLQAIRKGFLHV